MKAAPNKMFAFGLSQMQQIKICIWVIIIGLVLSGLTAFPLETELEILSKQGKGTMQTWIQAVYNSVKNTNQIYPWLSYGTDWLAFAHLMLAVLFIGPLKNPVKNIWVIEFGIIACTMIFPLAFIAGSIRGIPFFWKLIDCSFGVIGLVPLLICYRKIKNL